MRGNWRAVAQLLQVVDDHLGTRRKARIDDPTGAYLRAERHRFHVSFTVGSCNVNLLQALKFRNRYLRNQQRVVPHIGLSLHPPKLPDSEYSLDWGTPPRCE